MLIIGFTEGDQAWLLNEAAYTLRGLGRLTEALEPMRAGLEKSIQQEDWKNAAIGAANLSELELTLGRVDEAVADGERILAFTQRSDEWGVHQVYRASYADALNHAGLPKEALTAFQEVEDMQFRHQPDYPLLYSARGFRYCDLLLADAERTAWQMKNAKRVTQNAEFIKACRAVSRRAAQTLEWAQQTRQGSLLDIALDHLTLGRAALYEAIPEHPDFRLLTSNFSHINAAVSGLRRAGTQDHLPRGLLTRAWLRSLTGAPTGPESAQSDLDEAWEIAERGSMRLHMADIHLHRARLFGLRIADSGLRNEEAEGGVRNEAAEPYPWESPRADLEAAEKLINDCGYHRRDEELADAKRAILGA